MNRKKKKYTGLYWFGGTLLVLIGLLAFLNTQDAKSELYGGKKVAEMNPATKQILDDPNYQQIILPDEISKKINNKDSFFVYFFASDCPSCQATTPKLMPLAKESGAFLHQYNLREFQEGFRQYNIEYTPTLVFFENGVEKERLVGGITPEPVEGGHTEEDFTQFFDKYKGSVKP
ncbi:thioredoxin family protein [Paenibacillus dakarensis]|uniref:thioredoxin family protein n=1 Tax=Paenibacillus dakarensis TaxID=1527293 RepID=UPI0006D5761F|nr:thioredoxin family protein [Paenibacillus dakarensis]